MKQMKKTMIGLSVALIAGASHLAIAQTQQQSQSQQQMQQQQQLQQVQQQTVSVEEVLPQARTQVNAIDNQVGLNLSEDQVDQLSESMAGFMVAQYSAQSQDDLRRAGMAYEQTVNSVLTDEQKEAVANYNENLEQ